MSEYGCKVCRVLDEREMERYEDRLLEQWRGPPESRLGYRRLAKWLNVTMLRREMDRHGLDTLGDEAESKYERLTGDDETVAGVVRRSLRDEGVSVDNLFEDFVSYGVVRTHLKECLDAEREADDTGAESDWEQEAIDIAEDHAERKVSEAVTTLMNKGDLRALPEIDVTVNAEVECPRCGLRIPLRRALRRGYVCDCPTDGSSEEVVGDD